MHSQRLQTVDEIRAFLPGVAAFDFEPRSREEADRWIQDSLRQLGYSRLVKAYRGIIKVSLEKVSGRPRVQVTRLIRPYRDTGRIWDHRGRPANAFPFGHVRLQFRKRLGVHQPMGVAMLKILHIERTKSRPRQSNDNALVESKNGCVVWKASGVRTYSTGPACSPRSVSTIRESELTPADYGWPPVKHPG